MAEGRIIGPGKEPGYHVAVERIQRTDHVKDVSPVADWLFAVNLGRKPGPIDVNDFQMQRTLSVDENILGGITEVVSTGTKRNRVGFCSPPVTGEIDASFIAVGALDDAAGPGIQI